MAVRADWGSPGLSRLAGMAEGIIALMSEPVASQCGGTGSDSGDSRGREPGGRPRLQALMDRSRTMRVLLSGSPAFRLLMFGSSISMLGTRISTVAFPMLVLHLHKSPFITGLVAFAAIAPSMLFYIPAGVLVDRYNPRRVMLVSEVCRGAAIFSVVIALLAFTTHISMWFLIPAMVAEEIFEVFSVLADRRFMNRMIERDKIESRQSSIEVRTHAAVLAGRPIGPFLFSVQPFLPFLADALSFIASIVSLALVRSDGEPPPQENQLRLADALSGIGQGFGWLSRNRRAWLTIVLMAMTSMVAQALILIFLVEAHSRQFSTVEIGIVLTASGVGGAVGSFGSRIVPAGWRTHWLQVQMIAWLLSFSMLACAGGSSVYFSAITMFVMSITGAIGNVEFGTYLARNTGDGMIAKVSGISHTVMIAACAIGPVLGGAIVESLKVKGAVLAIIVIVALMALVSLLASERGMRVMRGIRAVAWRSLRVRRVEQAIADTSQPAPALSSVPSPDSVTPSAESAILLAESVTPLGADQGGNGPAMAGKIADESPEFSAERISSTTVGHSITIADLALCDSRLPTGFSFGVCLQFRGPLSGGVRRIPEGLECWRPED